MPKRLHFCIAAIIASTAALACASEAMAIESEALVSLFKSHEPFNAIYVAGPLRLAKSGNTAIGTGIFKISRESASFQISPVAQKMAPELVIASPELKLEAQNGEITAGVSATKLRHYRGSLILTSTKSGLSCRNRLPMKDYINSVVGSETLIDFPLEALKAQSVLIQTAMQRYQRNDELNDSTEKQAYLGDSYVRTQVREAVSQTWGETLVYKGHPLSIYFHAACAGGTSSSELFTGKIPQTPCDVSVSCNYCKKSPFWKATRYEIPAATFASKFPEGVPDIKIRDLQRRPLQVSFADSSGASASAQNSTGYDFWLKVGQRLGWDKMPGTRFQVNKLASGNIELVSTGAGHGVGLCQWGAAELARRGKTYAEILRFYFPAAALARKK